MYCTKCGKQNEDNAKFCVACGEKLDGTQGQSTAYQMGINMPYQAKKKSHKKAVIGITVVAVILILIISAGTSGSGRGYEETVDKYLTAQFDGDAEAVFEMIPEKAVDYLAEEADYDKDEMIQEVNKSLKKQMNQIDKYLGNDWEISYEITETEDVKGDNLSDLKNDYKDMGIDLSAAKKITIEITIKAGDTETDTSMNIGVIETGGSWYIDITSVEL